MAGLTLTDALLLIAAALLAAYLAVIAVLAVTGRRAQARAIGGFVPDCAVLFARLARDPALPRRRRLALVALAAYLASPIDLVPDFLPVAGQADDAVLVVLTLRWILRGSGPGAARAPLARPGRLAGRAAAAGRASSPQKLE